MTRPAWRWVPAIYLASFFLGNLTLVLPVRRWLGGTVHPSFRGVSDWGRRLGQTGPIGASIVTMRVLMNGDMIMLGGYSYLGLIKHPRIDAAAQAAMAARKLRRVSGRVYGFIIPPSPCRCS